MKIRRVLRTPNVDVRFTIKYVRQTYDEELKKYDIDFTSPLIRNNINASVYIDGTYVPIVASTTEATHDWQANCVIKCDSLGINISDSSTGEVKQNLKVNTSATVYCVVSIYRLNENNNFENDIELYTVTKTITISCEPLAILSRATGSVDVYGMANTINILSLLNPVLNGRLPVRTICTFRGSKSHHYIDLYFNGKDGYYGDENYVIPSFSTVPSAYIPISELKKRNSIKAIITPCDYAYNQKQQHILKEFWDANKINANREYTANIYSGEVHRGFNMLSKLYDIKPNRSNRGVIYKCTFNAYFSVGGDEMSGAISVVAARDGAFNINNGIKDIVRLKGNTSNENVVEFLFTVNDAMLRSSDANNIAIVIWCNGDNYIRCSNLKIVELDASSTDAEKAWMKLHNETLASDKDNSDIKPITVYNHFDIIVPPFETCISINPNKIVNVEELEVREGKIVLYPGIKISGRELMGEDLFKLFIVDVYIDGVFDKNITGPIEYEYNRVVNKDISISVKPKLKE